MIWIIALNYLDSFLFYHFCYINSSIITYLRRQEHYSFYLIKKLEAPQIWISKEVDISGKNMQMDHLELTTP